VAARRRDPFADYPCVNQFVERHGQHGRDLVRRVLHEVGLLGLDQLEDHLCEHPRTEPVAIERQLDIQAAHVKDERQRDYDHLGNEIAKSGGVIQPALRCERTKPPSVPTGYQRNLLGHVVPATIWTPRPILSRPPVPKTHLEQELARAHDEAAPELRWAPLLLGQLAEVRLRMINLAHANADGYAKRYVWRVGDVAVTYAGEIAHVQKLRGYPLKLELPRTQIRECRLATGRVVKAVRRRKGGAQKVLRLPRYARELISFYQNAAPHEVVVSLLDPGLGLYVETLKLAKEPTSTASLQRARIHELVRVPKKDTEPALLVVVTREQAMRGWQRRVLERVEAQVGRDGVPAFARSNDVLQWLLDTLTFGRGGGTRGGLSVGRLLKVMASEEELAKAMRERPSR
jgi:hypothetical protein